jgi:uncharacterized RDD family membrane protein YckC
MISFKNQVVISTPEYVRVPFETAGLGTRSLAKLLDLFCLSIVLLPVGLLISTLSTLLSLSTYYELPSVVIGLVWVVLAFIPFFYFSGMEYWWKGQTIGKKVFRLRVISDNGQDASFTAICLRNLLQIVDLLPGCYALGMATMFVHRQEKRIGDLVAGTLVVQERTARERELQLDHAYTVLSEADKERFADLDILPSERYFVLESFLLRRAELATDVRRRLAQQLIAVGWPAIEVFREKEEVFLEKMYVYLREVQYVAEQPQLVTTRVLE